MIERVQWEDLPAGLRTAVEDRTGTVITSTPVTQGLNSVDHYPPSRSIAAGSVLRR